VADVQHLHKPGPLENAVDDAIDMRFVAVKQVPEPIVLRRNSAPARRAAMTALGVILTRYAMGGFEFGEEFVGVASFSLPDLL
jgi:hypothetical protein